MGTDAHGLYRLLASAETAPELRDLRQQQELCQHSLMTARGMLHHVLSRGDSPYNLQNGDPDVDDIQHEAMTAAAPFRMAAAIAARIQRLEERTQFRYLQLERQTAGLN